MKKKPCLGNLKDDKDYEDSEDNEDDSSDGHGNSSDETIMPINRLKLKVLQHELGKEQEGLNLPHLDGEQNSDNDIAKVPANKRRFAPV